MKLHPGSVQFSVSRFLVSHHLAHVIGGAAASAEFVEIANPVPVSLGIGNDAGRADVMARIIASSSDEKGPQ
jgi:hypothetical protein